MAVPASDPGLLADRVLSALPDGLLLDAPADAPTRTYLPDGRRLGWYPVDGAAPLPIAVDAELAVAPIPLALSSRLPALDRSEFWRRWTGWEVVAKLTDQPMLLLVASGALVLPPGAEGVRLRTVRFGDLQVSAGVLVG